MQRGRTLDQQIAVFGEAGSGKTVLLSSFYAATLTRFKLDIDQAEQARVLIRSRR